eukprot:3582620-Lingulodinium_polyedra.AAC.1
MAVAKIRCAGRRHQSFISQRSINHPPTITHASVIKQPSIIMHQSFIHCSTTPTTTSTHPHHHHIRQ